jgi:signal transduction histidine kinase
VPSAKLMNRQLHGERIVRGTHQRRLHRLQWGDLPDGAFVLLDTSPAVVIGDQVTEWTREGYRTRRTRPTQGTADVITPPATVAALRAGYPVQIDDSARESAVGFSRRPGTTVDGLLARLETSFEAQRQFVANASHELRTPLTLERTLLELALSDPNASVDSYRHTCEQLLAVGEQQERLIEALLTLSRSQRGLDSHQPVDLAAIVSAAAAAADYAGLALDITIQPAHTTGNPRLVERLVANLLSNAIDHNIDDGNLSLTTDTRDGRAVLAVTNSGPTIPAGELDRLFQPFQRLDGSRTNNHGLGLGLSIVRAIADAHHATITTHAPADGGLYIAISFPAAASTGVISAAS